jgi:hypothetical protein
MGLIRLAAAAAADALPSIPRRTCLAERFPPMAAAGPIGAEREPSSSSPPDRMASSFWTTADTFRNQHAGAIREFRGFDFTQRSDWVGIQFGELCQFAHEFKRLADRFRYLQRPAQYCEFLVLGKCHHSGRGRHHHGRCGLPGGPGIRRGTMLLLATILLIRAAERVTGAMAPTAPEIMPWVETLMIIQRHPPAPAAGAAIIPLIPSAVPVAARFISR